MKRLIIVHGWASHPEDGWIPWLKRECEARGFVVLVPAMPHPMVPTIGDWVEHLEKTVGPLDQDTFFVGHSIGCQTILRYLETKSTQKIGGSVFVAGWFTLSSLKAPVETALAKPWLDTPIQDEVLHQVMPKSIAIFSDGDRYVPYEENAKLFQQRLHSEIILDPGKRHFSGRQGIVVLPSALEAVLKLASSTP